MKMHEAFLKETGNGETLVYKIKEGIQINHSISKESGSYLSDKVNGDKEVRIGEQSCLALMIQE